MVFIDRDIRKSLQLTFQAWIVSQPETSWDQNGTVEKKNPSLGSAMVSLWDCLSLCSFSRGCADTCWILLCSPFTYTAPTWDFCWKSMTLEIVTGSFRPAAFFPASSIFTYKTIWSTETEIFPQFSLCGIKWKKCSRISTSTEHHYSNEDILCST